MGIHPTRYFLFLPKDQFFTKLVNTQKMIRESLFLRLLVAGLMWLVMWMVAGMAIAFGVCFLFFNQPISDYMNVVAHVGGLIPVDILSADISEENLLSLAEQLFDDSRALQKQSVLMTVQGVSSFSGFVLSSLLIVKIYRFKISEFLNTHFKFSPKLYLFVPLLFISAVPFISYTGWVNAALNLPSFLEGTERWMREMEFQNGVLSLFLASGDGIGMLLISVLIMAVIPAIGEEFLFRGIMQRSLIDFKINPHSAIFITALVFSAMHMQFFGFFPRFFLGVILGYLYFWSGSIWVPIIGHFFQNASSVALIYWMNHSNQPDLSDAVSSTPQVGMALLSIAVTAGIGYSIYKVCGKRNLENESS